MNIAINITHPAHFHFFNYAIRILQERGHDVLILARDKDITLSLLDEAGFPYKCLSKACTGKIGLGYELVLHSASVLGSIKRHHSRVIAAVGGTFSVHPARLARIPSLVFYDTENATVSNRITYPYAARIFTPRAYRDDLGERHERYTGYQELAYLHPNYFTPDRSKLDFLPFDPDEGYSFVRVVAWESHHDFDDYGISDIREVVKRLGRYGHVLISSEAPLPDDLQHYQYNGRLSDAHHVLAHARLFFGESATMASESAQLGVPAIFLSTSSRGYTDELQDKYGLVFNFNGDNALQGKALEQAEAILSDPNARQMFQERRERMLSEQIDVTAYIVDVIEKYGKVSG